MVHFFLWTFCILSRWLWWFAWAGLHQKKREEEGKKYNARFSLSLLLLHFFLLSLSPSTSVKMMPASALYLLVSLDTQCHSQECNLLPRPSAPFHVHTLLNIMMLALAETADEKRYVFFLLTASQPSRREKQGQRNIKWKDVTLCASLCVHGSYCHGMLQLIHVCTSRGMLEL